MKVLINNKEMELPAQSTVTKLKGLLELPDKGVAIAISNTMIPCEEWNTCILQENDNIVIIKAACGG